MQPTPRLLRAAWLALRALTSGAWHWLVWDNVRAGTINLSGTPRSFRALMRLGLWLTLLLLVGLIFSDVVRAASRLQPLIFYTDDLAGIYVPELIVPVVFGLLAVAWAFLLAGALHAPWPTKLIVLILFAVFDYGLMVIPFGLLVGEVDLLLSGFGVSLWAALAVLVHGAGWLGLLLLFIVRWRQPARPGLEFSLMLAVAAALLFAAHFAVQLSGASFQSPTVASGLQLASALNQIDTLLIPFLVIAGVEVAQLGISLTGWISGHLRRSTGLQTAQGTRWWALGLGAFLIVRLVQQWLWPLFTGAALKFSWGAFIICGLLLALFALVQRNPTTGALPDWVVPGAAVLLYAILFLLEISLLVTMTAAVVFITASGSASTSQALQEGMLRPFNVLGKWNELYVSGVALLVGLALWWRARRRRQPLPPTALYAFILAAWISWWIFTRPDRPLGAFTFRYEHFASMMTLFLLALFLCALGLRRLTTRALSLLSTAAVLFWVLGARGWLSDPLSPLFVWLGARAAFLSVSVFLNVMNAGNRFALNTENPRWSRLPRSLLYFGYALLTVTSIVWLAASHQADAIAAKDLIGQNGFIAIGLPLALWSLITGSEDLLGPGDGHRSSYAL
jgi:hypothetical protein